MFSGWGRCGWMLKVLLLCVFLVALQPAAQAQEENTAPAPAALGGAGGQNATSPGIISGKQKTAGNATSAAYDPETGSEKFSTRLSKITPPDWPQPMALRIFRLIPPTIFENTVEGLDENGKQELADTGKSGPWVLTELSDNDLEFTSSVPHSGTKVRLHLYHAVNGDILIACGVHAGESCALELWRRDAKGRIVPVAVPNEPDISEFLEKGRVLPEGYEVSMLFCLDIDDSRLRAIPMLWTPSGLGDMSLDYDIYYRWDGEKFNKESVAHTP